MLDTFFKLVVILQRETLYSFYCDVWWEKDVRDVFKVNSKVCVWRCLCRIISIHMVVFLGFGILVTSRFKINNEITNVDIDTINNMYLSAI